VIVSWPGLIFLTFVPVIALSVIVVKINHVRGKDARGKLGIQMIYLQSVFTNSKPIVKIRKIIKSFLLDFPTIHSKGIDQVIYCLSRLC
jgi:hypothetical protein